MRTHLSQCVSFLKICTCILSYAHTYIYLSLLCSVCVRAVSLGHLCKPRSPFPPSLSPESPWQVSVRQTDEGKNSAGMWGYVLFIKINHLDKDVHREFILNSCKSKLLNVTRVPGDATGPHHAKVSFFPSKEKREQKGLILTQIKQKRSGLSHNVAPALWKGLHQSQGSRNTETLPLLFSSH